jgi:hypothetical protein
MNAMHEELENF